mmetsp:Transcript_58521/g.163191  ORF Transcript_58521/g.163191 Transcript_58521/m.163191 type:complete len:257 (-) Transcript_58521:119-889(-)
MDTDPNKEEAPSPTGARRRKSLWHKKKSRLEFGTNFAEDFDRKNIPLENSRELAQGETPWEECQFNAYVAIPATELEHNQGEAVDVQVTPAAVQLPMIHTPREQPPSCTEECPRRGIGEGPDTAPSSWLVLRWDRLHLGLTEAEALENGVVKQRPSTRERVRQRLQNPVPPEELHAATAPLPIDKCAWPPIAQRCTRTSPKTSHYEFFARHCPTEPPRNRLFMEQRVVTTQRALGLVRSRPQEGHGDMNHRVFGPA